MFIITLVPIVILCLAGLIIAPFLTGLLYPTLINDAEPYIFLASTGVLVGSATNLIMPMIMSVCSMKDLFTLQSVQFGVYILFAYIGSTINGLRGFCYAVLLVNFIKVAMNYFLGLYRVKKVRNDKI